jgi:hypothetical protein
MQSMLTKQRKTQMIWVAASAVTTLAISVHLILGWPHNYDEAFNYLYFADRGFGFVVTDYSYPNNHILFTLIQALIPRAVVDAIPLALRGPNVLVSVALIVVLTSQRVRTWASIPRSVALVFAGTWAFIYFPVARGYQLGTLLIAATLLLIARYVDRRWCAAAAAILMVLAAWAVPTFVYGAPAIALVYAMMRRWRDAVVFSVGFLTITLLLYLPVLDQLFGESTNSVNAPLAAGRFATGLVANTFFLPWWASSAVFIAAAIGLFASFRVAVVRRDRPVADLEAERSRWSMLLLGYVATFVLVAEIIGLATSISSPFWRNASFVAPFIIVGLWSSPLWANRIVRVALIALLTWNVAIGVDTYLGIADGSDITVFPGTEIGHTPRLDDLVANPGVEEVRCYWTDEWACRMYQQRFEDNGIRVVLVDVPPIEASGCVVGRFAPRPGTGIAVLFKSGNRGLVCFG